MASYLTDHVIPCVIGRDPFQTEDIWQYLYRGAYWRRGPVTMSAIGAVDVALWDIKGKALKTPVYNLLGGKSREGVLVYGHANGRDTDAALEDVARHVEQGFKAVRVQSGIPGLSATYGISRGQDATSRLSAACLRSTSVLRSFTCATSLRCSGARGRPLARACTCCMTAIIASRRLKQDGWARNLSHTIFSGWKTPRRRSYKRASR